MRRQTLPIRKALSRDKRTQPKCRAFLHAHVSRPMPCPEPTKAPISDEIILYNSKLTHFCFILELQMYKKDWNIRIHRRIKPDKTCPALFYTLRNYRLFIRTVVAFPLFVSVNNLLIINIKCSRSCVLIFSVHRILLKRNKNPARVR